MRTCVLAAQAPRLDPGVYLRRRDARVPKKLLDRSQIRAALEQMRGEGVAQRVRRDVPRDGCLAYPAVEPAAHVGRRQAPPAARHEQRGLLTIGRERRARL